MMTLTRKQIRSIRATLRQSLGITSARRAPSVTLRTTETALLIQAATEKAAIEFSFPANLSPDAFAIPYEALIVSEGKQDDPVSFTRHDDTVVLHWADGGIPQSHSFAVTDPVEMPPLPENLITMDARFLPAMADAAATANVEATRYAWNCIRLRGRDGQIAATDSCQALVQTGFSFPWTEDVLIEATDAFACSEFITAGDIRMGCSADWVTIQANSCTLHMRIEKERRFPDIDLQIPPPGSASTTLSLSDNDSDFLVQATKRLPGSLEPNSPVTVDLNGVVAVRAESLDQSDSTELILSNSRRVGQQLCFNTDRTYLSRAARLGFREIQLLSATNPACCRDDYRTYIWAVLGDEAAIQPTERTVRISSPVISTTPVSPSRTPRTMTSTSSKSIPAAASAGSAVSAVTDSESAPSLLAQAETLRDSLSKALSDSRDLISLIKRNQKQNRLVETTLRSLKQLEHIGA